VPAVTLTLIGKPGCHLCEDAQAVVDRVVAGAPADPALATLKFTVEEKSILDDAALMDEYVEQIPVLLINGKVHNYWHIDPVRLTTALKGLA
jgi:glutaredoxin